MVRDFFLNDGDEWTSYSDYLLITDDPGCSCLTNLFRVSRTLLHK